MANGNFTADGSSDWFELTYEQATITLDGDFGGGTVAVEKQVNGNTYPIKEGASPITYASAYDTVLNIGSSMKIRFTLTGATAPNIDWTMGARQIRKA